MKLAELAQITESKLEGDEKAEITDVSAIESAGREHICFVTDKKYLAKLEKSRAGAVIAKRGMAVPQGMNVLRHDDPDSAFSKVVNALRPAPAKPQPGISESAQIGKRFEMGENASIGHFVVLGDGVTLGRNVIIHPHVVICDEVSIGDDTEIYPNVTIMHDTKIGRRCVIHAGAVIGADGFGFHFVGGKFEAAPQRGQVIIEDDVSIGANTAIDRARFGVTKIGSGTKLDNLVQIGHNVQIGNNCVIAGQAGIAGSTTLKDYVQIGGTSGISDHLTIGMGAKIAAMTGIMRDIEPGMKMAGAPAEEVRTYMKIMAAQRKMPETLRRVKELEVRLDKHFPPSEEDDD